MLTVLGFGPTTNTAYASAREEMERFTQGDPRVWTVTGERYVITAKDKDKPVICELEYTRLAGVGEDEV